MTVLSFVNQKGGVGKTTTAVNIATAFAAIGKKTLIIDLDSQGNATTAFGISPEERSPNIYDVIVNNVDLADSLIQTEIPHLSIAPAVIDLSACDVELSSMEGREYILSQAIEKVRDDFDFIFIDCPPSLGLLTINALTASDSLIIPLQCEFYALEGLSYLLNTVELVKSNLNTQLEISGLVLTMYDRRNRITRQVEKEVRQYFDDKVFNNRIPRNVKLSEAPSHGKPGIVYDHRCNGSIAYMLLAKEMLKRFSQK